MKFELNQPFTFEGKEYTEFHLNLEELTGDDILNAEKEFTIVRPGFVGVSETSKEYLAILAARSAKLPSDLFFALPAKDFIKLTMAVMNFLLV